MYICLLLIINTQTDAVDRPKIVIRLFKQPQNIMRNVNVALTFETSV